MLVNDDEWDMRPTTTTNDNLSSSRPPPATEPPPSSFLMMNPLGHVRNEQRKPKYCPWLSTRAAVILIVFLTILVIVAIGTGVGLRGNKESAGESASSETVLTRNDAPEIETLTSSPTPDENDGKNAPTSLSPMTSSPSNAPSNGPTWVSSNASQAPTDDDDGHHHEAANATQIPSPSPNTFKPSMSPTGSPSTSFPTSSPSTPSPTKLPTAKPTITPVSSSSTSLNIEIVYVTSMSDAEIQAFEYAKARWQSLIVSGIPSSVIIPIGVSICQQPPRRDSIIVDDIIIFAEIIKIDGPGKVLGQAGPCGFDTLDRVRAGLMSFDSADTALMVQDGTLPTVILHEMGHVLGLGTMWDYFGLITPGKSNIQYLGEEGNAGNLDIGGIGRAIIEDTGGDGTARGHWKESVYRDELMTGYISGPYQPLSALTARALRDLGYVVDVFKADPFTLGSSGRRLRGSQRRKFRLENDIYSGPIVILDLEIPKPGREEEYRKSKLAAEARRQRRKQNLTRTTQPGQ